MAFKTALAKIVTERMIEGYSQKYTGDYIDFFCEFERKKQCFTKNRVDFTVMRVPVSFTEECSKTLNKSLTTLISYSEFKNHISLLCPDKMKIDIPTFKAFFKPACDGIVKQVKEFFLSLKVKGVDTILMVGGFSESKILQEVVQKAFPHCQVIVPENAGVAVLHGAVLFGYSGYIIADNCET